MKNVRDRIAAAALVIATGALPNTAAACGGFFCGVQQPVDQAAEEIVFGVDDDLGRVTMHVKIAYEGDAADFAWVVPVAGLPELQIGTDALFPLLSSLRAQFSLVSETPNCSLPSPSPSTASADSGAAGGGVTIVSTGVVGPYETVVLQATDSGELVAWLQDAGFDLPATLDDALAPYIADGQYFVALKLAKDRNVGDLEPLAITYDGTLPSIPIRLTSIAATPDMGLRVYVLGEHRAVPESYLHVQINELAIDWWTFGANLESTITKAADEAGGHAFFTDYSGPSGVVQNQLYSSAWDTFEVATADGVADVLTRIVDAGLPFDDALMGVLSTHFGLPDESVDELDLIDVVNCLAPFSYYGYSYTVTADQCYPDELAAIVFDAAALDAEIEAVFLEPRRRTDAMLAAYPMITRLTSSVSPVEMTVDPTFVFNADLPPVNLVRTATEVSECDASGNVDEAPRELQLSDGRNVPIPSRAELRALGLTEIQWLEQQGLTTPTNAVIEQGGSSGPNEILVDNRPLLADQLAQVVEALGGGCGCDQTGRLGATVPLLGALIALRRRRRS